ncbi:uncharacterized protein LOC111639676, partial [Centruroides sculpturatus]|uniref:uncharacterized protein LOC111639676 n=1 Tax=Centruroides sculpturatus TaxID=218467 RepID=UPI000C6EA66B
MASLPVTSAESMGDSPSTTRYNRSALSNAEIMKLLNFPNDVDWRKTLLFVVDPGNGPYNIEDFVPELKEIIDLKDIIHFGVSVVTHVFTIGLKNEASVENLLNKGTINVKGKPCNIISIENRKIIATIHWLPPELSHELVTKHFINYGRIVKCEFVKCNVEGLEHILTNKRRIWIELKRDVNLESLLYFIKVKGMSGAVVIAGRPPLCYRCKNKGHLRRQCTTPKCKKCNKFGHNDDKCLGVTFASKLQNKTDWAEIMDDLDKECSGSIQNKGNSLTTAAGINELQIPLNKEVNEAEVSAAQNQTTTSIEKDETTNPPAVPYNNENSSPLLTAKRRKKTKFLPNINITRNTIAAKDQENDILTLQNKFDCLMETNEMETTLENDKLEE